MLLIPVKTQIVIYPQGKDAENSMWKPYVGKTGVLDGYYNAEEWCYVVLDVSTLSTAWCHVPSPELSDWLLGWQGDGDPAGRRKPFKTDVIAPDPDAATAPSRPIPEGVPPEGGDEAGEVADFDDEVEEADAA